MHDSVLFGGLRLPELFNRCLRSYAADAADAADASDAVGAANAAPPQPAPVESSVGRGCFQPQKAYKACWKPDITVTILRTG